MSSMKQEEYIQLLQRELNDFRDATGFATARAFLAVKKEWEPKIGDVVKLRSGSPEMTVIAVDPKIVTCWWPCSGDGQYSFDVMRNSVTWDDVRLLEPVR